MVTGAGRMGGGVAKAPLAAPTPISLPCSHSEFSPRLEPALNSWITEGATEQQQRQLQKPVALLLSVPCTCNSALRHRKPLTHVNSHILLTFTLRHEHNPIHTHTQAHLYTKTHTHSYTCKTSHTHKQHTQAIRQMHKCTSSHKHAQKRIFRFILKSQMSSNHTHDFPKPFSPVVLYKVFSTTHSSGLNQASVAVIVAFKQMQTAEPVITRQAAHVTRELNLFSNQPA